jgi:hypothetical protein
MFENYPTKKYKIVFKNIPIVLFKNLNLSKMFFAHKYL